MISPYGWALRTTVSEFSERVFVVGMHKPVPREDRPSETDDGGCVKMRQ